MSLRRKCISIVLLSVLVSAAVAVPHALADKFTASKYTATISGEQTSATKIVIGGNRTVQCATVTFQSSLTAEAGELKLSPKYENCSISVLGNTFDLTVEPNECDLLLKEPAKAEGIVKGLLTVVCPAEKTISLRVYSGTKVAHTEANQICHYMVGSQENLSHLRYSAKSSGGVANVGVQATLSGLAVKKATGTLAACGAASQTATYTGDLTLKASKSGEPINWDLSSMPPLQFTAAQYSATVLASQSGQHALVIGGNRTLNCSTANFSGSLAAATDELTVSPEYAGCAMDVMGATFDATFEFNECDYLFTQPGGGAVDVKCPAGKSVTIKVYNGTGVTHNEGNEVCRYTIDEQTGLGGVAYENGGSPTAITVSTSVSGIALKRVKGGLSSCGSATLEAAYGGKSLAKVFNGEGSQISGDVNEAPPGEFTAAQYTATVLASQSEQHVMLLGGNRSLSCMTANFSGALAAASNELTVSPEYAGCVFEALGTTFDATFEFNECDYLFTQPSKGLVDLKCPTGKSVTIKVFSGTGVVHNEGNEICRYTISPQNSLGAVTYENGGSPTAITVTTSVAGIALKRVKGVASVCGSESLEGAYSGKSLAKVFSGGIQINGDVEEAPVEKFTASQYPAVLRGTQVGSDTIVIGGTRTISCTTMNVSGSLGAASKEVTISPEYAGCGNKVGESTYATTIDLAECHLQFKEPAGGKVDVKCPAGKAILIRVYSGTGVIHTEGNEICRYSIGEQTLGGNGYTTNGGSPKTVTVKSEISGVAVKRVKGTEGNCGAESQTAKTSGETLLKAFTTENVQIDGDIG